MRSCRPPGSVTWMPFRVVNTGRTLPIAASATFRFTHEPRRREDEGDREERALAPQHRQEDVLIADLAKPEPVGVEAKERRSSQEEQEREREKGEAKG